MVKINYFDNNNVLVKLRSNSFDEVSYFNLQYLANSLLLKGKKEKLMVLDEIKDKITLFPHQLNASLRYLNEMSGRAVLADEVGLGKTIEAGIIMKELIAREDISKIIILTPASLSLQWQTEMADKFLLNFEFNKSVHKWSKYPKIISSIDTAKMDKHIDEISLIDWDLLIVDEAHRLKNPETKTYKSLQKVRAKNKLFLTATPLQNSIFELYYLINLLDDGFLGTKHEFNRLYAKDNKGLEIQNHDRLNNILSEIMIRTTRKEAGLEFTKRNVATVLAEQTKEEIEFQDIAFGFISNEYERQNKDLEKSYKGVGKLQLMILARMLTSCRYSFSKSFQNYLKKNYASSKKEADVNIETDGEKILQMNEILPENQKIIKIIELVKKINDKVVIFTQFRNTQSLLLELLEKEEFKCDLIKGGMTPEEKKQVVLKFKRGDIDILISTESGSEGLNLQFCHHLINYDLPWNPMRIEQRIGRIHRIGQEFDVYVYNIVVKGSIEEYILDRLFSKLNLFQLAVGEMADIIENVLDQDSFDNTIFEMIVLSKHKIDLKKKMESLFSKLAKSKEYQEKMKELDKTTLDSFNLSPMINE